MRLFLCLCVLPAFFSLFINFFQKNYHFLIKEFHALDCNIIKEDFLVRAQHLLPHVV